MFVNLAGCTSFGLIIQISWLLKHNSDKHEVHNVSTNLLLTVDLHSSQMLRVNVMGT